MGGFCSGVSKPLGLRAAGDTLGPACSTSAALEQLPDERNGIGGVLRSHEPQSATPAPSSGAEHRQSPSAQTS